MAILISIMINTLRLYSSKKRFGVLHWWELEYSSIYGML